MNKVTSGTPTKDGDYIVRQNITDKFTPMVMQALAEQRRILTQRKSDLEIWSKDNEIEFKKIFGISDEKARVWILKGVNGMLNINLQLKNENFKPTSENVHASINPTQDVNIIVEIGKKFIKDPVTGKNSRVATLCHEMSHLGINLNSSDVGPSGKNPLKTTPADFQMKADELVSEKSTEVMQNAYNIERYFEID